MKPAVLCGLRTEWSWWCVMCGLRSRRELVVCRVWSEDRRELVGSHVMMGVLSEVGN